MTAGVAVVTLGLERGFIADRTVLVSEQDLLGERISRPPRWRKRADQFIAEATEIAEELLAAAEAAREIGQGAKPKSDKPRPKGPARR